MLNKFIYRYLLITFLLFFITRFHVFVNLLEIEKYYTVFATQLASKVASLFCFETSINDENVLSSQGFSLKILFGCNGLEAILIYLAGVLSVTAPVIFKIKWMLMGAFLLITINTLRLVFLLYMGIHYPTYFELMHLYVTQSIMVFISIGIFLYFSTRISY